MLPPDCEHVPSAFPVLQAEARKFNIDITVAHQWRNQLDEENRGSTLTSVNKIIFQVNPDDAKELAWIFDTTPPPAEGIPRVATRPVYKYVEKVVGDSPEWEQRRNELEKQKGLIIYKQRVIIRVFYYNEDPDFKNSRFYCYLRGSLPSLEHTLTSFKKIISGEYINWNTNPGGISSPQTIANLQKKAWKRVREIYDNIKHMQERFDNVKQIHVPDEYMLKEYVHPDYDTCYAIIDNYKKQFELFADDREPYHATISEIIRILEQLQAEDDERYRQSNLLQEHLKTVEEVVPTGLYEPVYDWMHIYKPQPDPELGIRQKDIQLYTKEPAMQRLRADVANEIAGELINLNYFTAKAKLIIDGKLTETTINITPLPDPPSDWQETTWRRTCSESGGRRIGVRRQGDHRAG